MRRIILLVLQVVVGGVFIAAAIMKGLHPPDPNMPWDTNTMYGNLLGGRLWLNYVFVAGELLLGLWLISGIALRKATLATIIVLAVFSTAIGAELSKDHPRPCGCMPEATYLGREAKIRQSLYVSLGRDFILLAAAAAAFILARPESPNSNPAAPEPTPEPEEAEAKA